MLGSLGKGHEKGNPQEFHMHIRCRNYFLKMISDHFSRFNLPKGKAIFACSTWIAGTLNALNKFFLSPFRSFCCNGCQAVFIRHGSLWPGSLSDNAKKHGVVPNKHG
jgi:hypothetical protein